jgi:hypothetical protein
MDYEKIERKYTDKFEKEYSAYISDLINEVKSEKSFIDYSIYTSRTVEKPSEITKEFLKSENIKDHRITNITNTFSLNLSMYLEMITFKRLKKLNADLFNLITEKNKEITTANKV